MRHRTRSPNAQGYCYVAGRIIDACANFDYPSSRYEIHVLDDSTDDTGQIIDAKVEEYKSNNIKIRRLSRVNRDGFKAGALQNAIPYANGQYLAIFDADFVPKKDFLKRTMPYFVSPEIAVVQTRWEHLNANYNILTRAQAMALNVHFTIEQAGRYYSDVFLQFNGTAGMNV
ncbi:unnamed protein product [Didymodactylos carnosus]|uniref:Glycosyltransferase 2-like domain-containing protein n=1 Tax=Didymodactylos carnosus TaxID=1234261 RepID=A0A813VUG7_9BILA|nr:unnamed protein product [Didymodactylos carnosus]CAF1307696.1 unnamed protein product [Didymodactylos carnosus]CAF3635923.1 unnamed protein product [Didymodactylos carnosus]CAF4114900.1 unnamed protein product [Didymodactylos carnosus]